MTPALREALPVW